MQVVDEASAVLGYPGEEAIPVDADHVNIAKIDSMDTQQWRSIIGALRRQIKDLELDEKYQRSLPSISG